MNDGELILVSLHIGSWDGMMKDDEATEKLNREAGADKDVGRVSKRIVPDTWFRPIQKAQGLARMQHRLAALPWADDGTRLLSIGKDGSYFFEYESMMLVAQDHWQDEVTTQLQVYKQDILPDLTEQARRMGTLFDANNFPSVDDLRRRFYFTLNYSTIPAPEAFDKYNVLGLEVERIKKNVAERVTLQMEAAVKDSWLQMHKAVAKMADRLSSDGRLYDSVLGNLSDVVHRLKFLNITNDPELEEMRAAIEMRLCQHDPKDVRANKTLKRSLAAEAKSMVADLAAFI